MRDETVARNYAEALFELALRNEGLQIARRTVTKYREQKGIPSSRLRKAY